MFPSAMQALDNMAGVPSGGGNHHCAHFLDGCPPSHSVRVAVC